MLCFWRVGDTTTNRLGMQTARASAIKAGAVLRGQEAPKTQIDKLSTWERTELEEAGRDATPDEPMLWDRL